MVFKFFDKKTSRGTVKSEIAFNKKLAEEWRKPFIRKHNEWKVRPPFTENIWDTDIADMQLTSKFNKGFRFLLCVIDIYRKYACIFPLKDKKGITITIAFQIIVD